MQVTADAKFLPALMAARWSLLAVSGVLVIRGAEGIRPVDVMSLLVLFAWSVARSAGPLRKDDALPGPLAVIIESALPILAVVATGGPGSPLALTLLTPALYGGFTGGFATAVGVALACGSALVVPAVSDAGPDTIEKTVLLATAVCAVALVGAYTRHISTEAEIRHSTAVEHVRRLSDANRLLQALYDVAQTLPTSLDIDDVLDDAIGRIKSLMRVDHLVVALVDDTSGRWLMVRREGLRLPPELRGHDLPPPALRALSAGDVVVCADLQGEDGPGFAGRAGSGMYAPFFTRGALRGLLAVESRSSSAYGDAEAVTLRGILPALALAVDNALWFDRLITVGADEERRRIARDLHDRIGQSLAYLAFETDRLLELHKGGKDLGDAIEQLREDVRGVISEVRDTLYDLRTDVSETRTFDEVLREFAGRLGQRSEIRVELDVDASGRLPVVQERELWRIAQEAMINAERHARATTLKVVWRCDGRGATLVVSDDGVGMPENSAGRIDSYGILGMRERAAGIGAKLQIESQPGKGTTVRCQLRADPERR